MSSVGLQQGTRAIILDRDGVINQDSDHYIKSVEEWQPIPGSIEAIVALADAGYSIGIATNQSGLARGLFSRQDLAAMHEKLFSLIAAAGGIAPVIAFCPHHPDDNCSCRKPKTGLIVQLESELGVPLTGAFFVGDSYSDVLAARAHGCVPVLVRTGKGRQTEQRLREEKQLPELGFDNLEQFSRFLLRQAQIP
jgi:D-glycero-D-manno-heptose 1,7-bisphosphate phosphatase